MPSPLALDTRAKALLVVGLIVLVGLTVHRLWLAGPAGPYVAFSGATMGTTWEVKLASPMLTPDELRAAAAASQAALDEVVALMSSWEPDSEVSRFNAHRSTEPFAISASTADVLDCAAQANELTRRGFDITVGPLVEAWGFGTADTPPEPPSDETIAELRTRVGQALLELDIGASTVRKLDPDVQIDLSAIAKGYGVDRVAEALERLGYRNYLVEVGGELRASGAKLDGRPWRVAIERPSDGARRIHQALDLRDAAMATSGDYRNFYEREGVRVSHTIDPRSGRPIEHDVASVTVIHDSAMWADAFATGLTVLGAAAGYHVAETLGLEAYFMIRRGAGSFESRPTTAMQARMAESAPPDDA